MAQHKRIIFSFVACLCGLSTGFCQAEIAQAAKPTPPNIVFIMSDDHAYQAVGAYGSKINETPNIDRIANEGIRFDRAYVNNSICSPSRAAILTGKYSHTNGVLDNFTTFNGQQWTFPKVLQSAGYQTAMIGKWHLKSDPTGFDHWDILPGQGRYYRPNFRTSVGTREVPGHVSDVTTDLAIDWLNGKGETGRQAEKPFLLMLHHKAPHRPWDPAVRHLKTFEDRDFPEPETLHDEFENRTSAPRDAEMRISQMRPSPDLKIWSKEDRHRAWLYKHMTEEQRAEWEATIDPRYDEFTDANLAGADRTRWMWQHYLEDYLGCVAGVDESVGRVLDWLDEKDLAENTIVIYMSDQGFYLGEHGWFDKRFMYEESLRTPMLLRWPAGVARQGAGDGEPRVESRIVANLDIAPTLLDAVGVEYSEPLHGISMLPLLKGDDVDAWRKTFYYHYHEGPKKDHAVARHDGVTDGSVKLIHFYELDEWELYDLREDPTEVKNQFDTPEYQSDRERLMKALKEKRSELDINPTKEAAETDAKPLT